MTWAYAPRWFLHPLFISSKEERGERKKNSPMICFYYSTPFFSSPVTVHQNHLQCFKKIYRPRSPPAPRFWFHCVHWDSGSVFVGLFACLFFKVPLMSLMCNQGRELGQHVGSVLPLFSQLCPWQFAPSPDLLSKKLVMEMDYLKAILIWTGLLSQLFSQARDMLQSL